MNTPAPVTKLAYDPRKLDADGLPFRDSDEHFFHTFFEVTGEGGFVEGVVAAEDGSMACSLLLAEEARRRFTSYDALRQNALHAHFRRLTRAEAIELLPKVAHRVSVWKSQPRAA